VLTTDAPNSSIGGKQILTFRKCGGSNLKLLSISYFLTDLQVDLNIMLQATVHLRDGTTKVFSESHSNESGDGTSPCGQSLSVKIQTMQEQVNSFLTELVEQEKSSGTAQNNKITADEGMH